MASGRDSILVMSPNGLSDIEFDVAGSDLGTGIFTINLGTLRFDEDRREKMDYAERVGAEGGALMGVTNPLAPLTFDAIISAGSRAACIQLAQQLRVGMRAGGRLKFKPDGLPPGVTSSFYHYLPSGPGGVRRRSGYRWDGPVHSDTGYSIILPVELMTFPLLTADPDSPVTVVAATTIYNHDDGGTGHDNFVTIPAASLKGDSRALLQITMRNLETGAYDDITGVYIFPRIYGLDNYNIAYEPGTVVVGASEWSTVSDAARSGGSYQRLTPSANDVAYRLRFAAANWTDRIGRHLLLIACRDNGSAEGQYEVRGGWSVGSGEVLDPTPWRSVPGEWLGEWLLFALGEIEFPGTQTVEVEEGSTTLYYELEVRRTGGSGTFEVDVFFAGPVDLRPMFVDCSERPFLNDHKLLLSNLQFPIQIAHIVDQSTLALVGPVKPRGLFPLANPGIEAPDGYRLYFLWLRREGSLVVNDDFTGYDANWLEIHDADSGWGVSGSTDRVEGASARQVGAGAATSHQTHTADYSGVSDDDYFCIPHKNDFNISRFIFYMSSDFLDSRYTEPGSASAWELHVKRKGDFSSTGSPDWSNILYISVYRLTGTYLYWDHWRWSKKDPDASQPNDFGSDWDYPLAGYPWFVFTDAGVSRAAGNPVPVGAESVPGDAEQLLIANMSAAGNIKMKGRCYVKTTSLITEGKVGVVFRVSDETSGSEDCYALIMDSAADTLTLYKYVAGTPTALASVGFTVAADTWYWLGVEAYENTITCYGHTSESGLWDSPLFEVTDTTHATGKCGLIVTDGLGRFDEVEVWVEGDRYTPGDTAQVEIKALCRSIYPHFE